MKNLDQQVVPASAPLKQSPEKTEKQVEELGRLFPGFPFDSDQLIEAAHRYPIALTDYSGIMLQPALPNASKP